MRPGEVCVLTKSLTTGVSGVPQSLSLDGMYRDTWAWSGRAGWRESALVGSFSGGRRRVRQAGGLARAGDRLMASTHVLCRRRSTANTPRRPKIMLLLAPGPIARWPDICLAR